jgi:hypothetical protein
MKSEDIVARARALVGVRFRPQGRSVEHGLDCIGAAAVATGMVETRRDYRLASADAEEVNDELRRLGFIRVPSAGAGQGDILVVQPVPGRLHVVVLTSGAYVHADMRLRRVVEVPGAVPWPLLSAWRHPAHEAGVGSSLAPVGERG